MLTPQPCPCHWFHQTRLSQWRKRFSTLREKWVEIHLNGVKCCTSPSVVDLSCTTFQWRGQIKHLQRSVIKQKIYVSSYCVSTPKSMVTQWAWQHISWGDACTSLWQALRAIFECRPCDPWHFGLTLRGNTGAVTTRLKRSGFSKGASHVGIWLQRRPAVWAPTKPREAVQYTCDKMSLLLI